VGKIATLLMLDTWVDGTAKSVSAWFMLGHKIEERLIGMHFLVCLVVVFLTQFLEMFAW
jgi:hypothetical protein